MRAAWSETVLKAMFVYKKEPLPSNDGNGLLSQ